MKNDTVPSRAEQALGAGLNVLATPLCLAASAAWVCLGLWPVWLATLGGLGLLMVVLDRRQTARDAGRTS